MAESSSPTLAWSAYEHEHRERSPEWFWTVGIIAVAAALAALILGNALFGVLIIISAFLLALFAAKQPDLVSFEINDKGIRIDKTLYPYRTLDSFSVTHQDEENHPAPKLLVQSQKALMPLLVIPLTDDIDTEALHDYLLQFMKEEEHREPISQRLLELIGL